MNKEICNADLVNYCVIDTEYLCYDPQHHVYQVAILKVSDNKISEQFSFIFNPHHPKSSKDYELNELTDEQLKNAPELEDEIEKVVELIGDDIIVGYNVYLSDISKLSAAYYLKTGKLIRNDYIDVMNMVASSNLPVGKEEGASKKVSLEVVCEYLGLTEKHHDALFDCISTFKVYEIVKLIPPYEPVAKSVNKPIFSKNDAYHFYQSKKESRYSYFEDCEFDGQVLESTFSTLKLAFSDCAPDTKKVVFAMKELGITIDNLYGEVRKRDNLDYVIIPDLDHPTCKGRNAIKYGINLISYDDFKEMLFEESRKAKNESLLSAQP